MPHTSDRKKHYLALPTYNLGTASPAAFHSQYKRYRQVRTEYCNSGSVTALMKVRALAEHLQPVAAAYKPASAGYAAAVAVDIVEEAAPTVAESGAQAALALVQSGSQASVAAPVHLPHSIPGCQGSPA